jgi:hypothetical protein
MAELVLLENHMSLRIFCNYPLRLLLTTCGDDTRYSEGEFEKQ